MGFHRDHGGRLALLAGALSPRRGPPGETLAAFALGLTLFLITLALNVVALYVVRKYRDRYD